MYFLGDTICAIATPMGRGGVGIVRVSGPQAFALASLISRKNHLIPTFAPQVLVSKFYHPQTQELLDEGLLLIMTAPKSYTTEDVVEFQIHGSPFILSNFIKILTQQGCRLAEPGEFTYRAYRHGRIDLTQAEAVETLVSAAGEVTAQQALRQLSGGLSNFLEPLEELLKSLYLDIESRLEFSEDGIPPLDETTFQQTLHQTQTTIQTLIASYAQGKILKQGLTVTLAGPPNVGKSSILNHLLGNQRSIVTPLPGTTRDLIEGELFIHGIKIRFWDTAGLRKTRHLIEQEGIARSYQMIKEADMIWWVADASRSLSRTSLKVIQTLPADRTWFLLNKQDLVVHPSSLTFPFPENRCWNLSCKTQQGFDSLLNFLHQWVSGTVEGDQLMLLSIRHCLELETALSHLKNINQLIQTHQPRELWAEELKEAVLAIGKIRGKNLQEEAFEAIFKNFCVGK